MIDTWTVYQVKVNCELQDLVSAFVGFIFWMLLGGRRLQKGDIKYYDNKYDKGYKGYIYVQGNEIRDTKIRISELMTFELRSGGSQ